MSLLGLIPVPERLALPSFAPCESVTRSIALRLLRREGVNVICRVQFPPDAKLAGHPASVLKSPVAPCRVTFIPEIACPVELEMIMLRDESGGVSSPPL